MLEHNGDREQSGQGDQARAGGEPIEPVDQVDGIGYSDEPDDRANEREPLRNVEDASSGKQDRSDAKPRPVDTNRNEKLAGELIPRAHRLQVIEQSQEMYGERATKHRSLRTADKGDPSRKDAQHRVKSERECDDEGNAAKPGEGFGMKTAIIARIEHTESRGEIANHSGQRKG